MPTLFLLFIVLSLGYTNQVGDISGNIQSFASMNTGSFISTNFRDINRSDKTLYSISFIRYPADIKFGELFFQQPINNYLITTRLSTLDFGTLQDINNNKFTASDKIIQLSILKINSNNLIIGSSFGYSWSTIKNYNNSLLIYSFGFNQSLFNHHLSFGVSLENYSHIIKHYSNFNDQYLGSKKISIKFEPKHLPIHILSDYKYYDINNSELSLAIQGIINHYCNIYIGKDFYLNSNNNTYSVLDNIATGVSLLIKDYKIDVGLQYISKGFMNLGISLTILVK